MTRRRLLLLAPVSLAIAGLAAGGIIWVERPRAANLRIGGPFALQDGNGRTLTEAAFRGKVMLVYFGYTHCPDACPTALQDMADAVGKLPVTERANVAVVFITVDPARDTPAVMKDYVSAFDVPITVLSGSAAATAQVADEYRVYYAKHPEKGGGYSMDHSSFIYIMNRTGHFVGTFSPEDTPVTMASKLQRVLA